MRSLKNMFNKITQIFLVFTFTFSLPVYADDIKHLDNTVAAGIVFKLGYLFSLDGTWGTMETANQKSFQNAMKSITKDLTLFSDTKRGEEMKKEARILIVFLSKGVRLSANPYDQSKPNVEAEAYLKSLGLDPKALDPIELTKAFTNRIAIYAKLSSTPEWVFDPSKR